MSGKPWTPADAAELDVLLHELVLRYFEHVERCDICAARRARAAGAAPCPHVSEAIDVVLDWRERRQLLTAAEELRLDRARLLEEMAA